MVRYIMSFETELIGGGTEIKASENIMFNRINPDLTLYLQERNLYLQILELQQEQVLVEVKFFNQNSVETVIPNQENDLNFSV